jgi:hypothetical protein
MPNTFQTIVVKTSEGGLGNGHLEKVASGTIKPGHLISEAAAGTVAVHGVSGGNPGSRRFAKENPHLGGDIDTNYVANDVVMIHEAQEGDIINCILAASQTITKNDLIMSNGDGLVVERTASNEIIGYAEEDVTTGVGVTARLLVRVKL